MSYEGMRLQERVLSDGRGFYIPVDDEAEGVAQNDMRGG